MRGLLRASTGGDRCLTGAHRGTPTGGCAALRIRYMGKEISVKNLQFPPVLRPDRCITSGKTHCNKLFTLVCDEFVLLLSAVSTAKVTVVYPRPQRAVHVHPSRRTKG